MIGNVEKLENATSFNGMQKVIQKLVLKVKN